jgi:hypothetical protein
MNDDPPPRRGLSAMTVALTALGLVLGGAAGWCVGRLIKSSGAHGLPWSDTIALLLGVVFLATGVLLATLAASRRGRALIANPRSPDLSRPASPAQTRFFVAQAAVLALAGAMLVAPVAVDLGAGRAAGLGPALMAGILAAFAGQTVLNVYVWLRSDEVFRAVISETGAICFWLLQGALFLWAAGEKLKVLPAITSWDAVTVLMAAYLVVSTVIAYRRGLS